eukprot:m.89759 g.89759  ORF g.89759 m.89759 type:complete len:89 (+) comp36624_c0_seq4:958-1224(+)
MHQLCHEQSNSSVHNNDNPGDRADSLLLSIKDKYENENKEVLRQIVKAVEFLGKQNLSFRGHRDDKVDFEEKLKTNRGYFIAILELLP